MSAMTEELTAILGAQQIAHKVRRMAFEIREQNYLEERIIIIGIKGGGYALIKNNLPHLLYSRVK
jgi:pyrimidine operon attenuation protein/uracil phosphoribosyltransferase